MSSGSARSSAPAHRECSRRSGWSSPQGAVTLQRSVLLSGEGLDRCGDRRRRASSSASRRARRSEIRMPSSAPPTSCATAARRSSCRSRPASTPSPAQLRAGVRGDARGSLWLQRRRAVARARDDPRDRDHRRPRRASSPKRTQTTRCSAATARAVLAGAEVGLEIIRGAPPPGTELSPRTVVELPESTLLVPDGWSGRVDQTGTVTTAAVANDRPGPATGPDRRPARDLRGDGRRADPRRALGQHQGAPRRLDRAVRPARRDGDAGRAHPRPPRRDARGGRGDPRPRITPPAARGSSTTRTGAVPTCPTSP